MREAFILDDISLQTAKTAMQAVPQGVCQFCGCILKLLQRKSVRYFLREAKKKPEFRYRRIEGVAILAAQSISPFVYLSRRLLYVWISLKEIRFVE
jgi:hypothetical protein